MGFQSCNPAVSLQPSLPACSALSSQSPGEKKKKKKDMQMTVVSYNINASLSDPVSISNVSNNLPLIVFLSCGTHSSCSYCLYNAAKQHVILRLSCVDQAPLFFCYSFLISCPIVFIFCSPLLSLYLRSLFYPPSFLSHSLSSSPVTTEIRCWLL